MTKARADFGIEPRGMTEGEVACYLGVSQSKFIAIKERLFARGFPAPDPDTHRIDRRAVDRWWDAQSDLMAVSPELAAAQRGLVAWRESCG